MAPELPEPECKYGFPRDQLLAIFGEGGMDAFRSWMRGQTIAICGTDLSEPCAGGHGPVVYPVDVRQYFRGGRPLD